MKLHGFNPTGNIESMDKINVLMDRKWMEYRLSDTLSSKNHNFNAEQFDKRWNGSICDIAHKRHILRKVETKKEVAQIVSERPHIAFDFEYTAIHLRIGDALTYWCYEPEHYETVEIPTKK